MKITTLLFLFLSLSVFGQEPVIISTPTGDLYGTLLADSNNKTNPIVFIIGGSGASTKEGFGDSQKKLAEALYAEGIYTLSVDKRGAGESASTSIGEKNIRLSTFVDDAVEWIQFLKDQGYSNIIVAGHSQGSLVGMLACQKIEVQKFISLAGVGRTIDIILKDQFSGMLPVFRDSASSVLDSLKKGVLLDTISPYLTTMFRPSVQPFLISWIKYNPTEEIKKLTIPILIVQGTTDIQVQIEDAELLHKAQPKSQLAIIEGMNHVYRDAPLDRDKNIATYKDTTLPVKKILISKIINFIHS